MELLFIKEIEVPLFHPWNIYCVSLKYRYKVYSVIFILINIALYLDFFVYHSSTYFYTLWVTILIIYAYSILTFMFDSILMGCNLNKSDSRSWRYALRRLHHVLIAINRISHLTINFISVFCEFHILLHILDYDFLG